MRGPTTLTPPDATYRRRDRLDPARPCDGSPEPVEHRRRTGLHRGSTSVTDGARSPSATTGDLPSTAVLALDGVRRDFGRVRAVGGVDLTVGRGEIVALLGPNGAGKTTTIELALGLRAPTEGRALVCGTSPARAIADGRVGAVLQDQGLLGDLTVLETVRYVASSFTRPRSVPDTMDRAGITAIADRLVGRCSGGERQRLRFALALLPDPDLLVLDEPTAGMDVEARARFWRIVREESQRGLAVLFTTHYLEEADDVCHRVVLMRRGVVVADGTPAQVRAGVARRTVRATMPGDDAETLRAIPGVHHARMHSGVLEVRTDDSDAVARFLLTRTGARDVEVVPAGLEHAYRALRPTADPGSLGRTS